VGEPNECDRVAGRDLDPIPVESRRGRLVEEFLELHQEVSDHRRNGHEPNLLREVSISRVSFVG